MFDKQDIVVQANKLIMSPQRFSYDEKRFLLCLISKINPFDEDLKSYRIQFDEYALFIGQDIDYVRVNLPKITKSIMSKILELEDPEEEEVIQRSIIIGSTHRKKLGFVDVKIHPDMKDVLLGLKERFTQYKLENALRMKSKHAIRLYEIIKANEFKAQKNFRLSWDNIPKEIRKEYPKEEIQKLLDTNYERFIDFENRVLKPAQQEMELCADACFDYEKVKVSRYVVAIDFFIKKNIPTEDNQISLFDIIPEDGRSLIQIAAEKANEIETMDRISLCSKFQDTVKKEYGIDFKLAFFEGVSNIAITEVMSQLPYLNIKNPNSEISVIRYIKKMLKSYK